MKKMLFACVMVLVLLSTVSSFAMEYVLGARAGFFFWSPFYKDMPEGSGFDDMRTGHGGLYGPIFLVNFSESVALSVSGLFGQQTAQWHSWNRSGISGSTPYSYSRTSYLEANRYDVDSALSYAVLPGLRVFAGYKFQYMKLQWNSTERRYDTSLNADDTSFEFRVPLHGIALGGGYSRNFTDLYFFTVNFSGIYTRGMLKFSQIRYKYDGTGPSPVDVSSDSDEIDMHQYGFNIEPSVGLRTAGPIVTLGVRYQLLRTQFYEINSSGSNGPDNNWMNDHLYGIFVAVLFMI